MAHSVVGWIEKNALNPLSGEPVKLFKWEIDLISKMYTPNGGILTPNWYAFGSKKTGKSALAAMLLAHRMEHNKRELYTVSAYSEDQAYVIYHAFIEIFSHSGKFFDNLKVKKNTIEHRQNLTQLRVLSKSSASAHGLRPSLAIFDEIMSFDDKNFDQMDVIEKSMTLRKNPQKFFLSNVPKHEAHKSVELLKLAEKDKEWIITKFQADRRLSWKNKRSWKTANPFYERMPEVRKYYQREFEKALREKQAEATFKRYCLGWGCSLDDSRWIDPQKLQWVPGTSEQKKILNNESFSWAVGLDLSLQGSDSTSWVLAGWKPIPESEDPLQDEKQKLYLFGRIFWGNISNKKTGIADKIKRWSQTGEAVWQNTQSIQQGPILDDLYSFLNSYPRIKENVTFVFDPHLSQSWIEVCQKDFPCITRTYSPKYMSLPIRKMQRMSELKNINILEAKNDAIEWQTSCGYVSEMSRNFCMLKRLNNNTQLNVDFWSASLLALSELLQPRPAVDAFVC